MYRFKKFVKKRRRLMAAVASIAALVLISLVIISMMYLNSEKLRIAAVKSEAKTVIAQKDAQDERDKAQTALIKEEKAKDNAERQLYCNRITLADLYKANNVMHALELLDSCREDLRGWEWHWLHKSSKDKALLYHLYGHTKRVNGVACSSDGKYMASVGNDFMLKIWDLQTGKNIDNCSGFLGSPISVMFSPDGKYVLTGSFDGVNRIWDIQTGTVVKSIDFGINDGTYQACYGPDGTYVISGNEKNIILWNIENEKEILNIPEHQGVRSIAINPDGKTYASVNSDDQRIKLWDTKSGKVIKILEGHTGGLHSIAYSPDGTKIVSGGEDKTIKLWNILSGTSSDLGRHEGKIFAVVFSPDGKTVASGGEDNIVRLWDVQTGASQRYFRGHSDAITSLSFAPDGKKLVSASKDTSIIIWDLQPEQNEKEIRFSVYNKIRSVAISPDTNYLMSTNRDSGIIQFLSIRTGKAEKQLAYPSVWEACYSLDGKYFAAASYDNSFKIWDLTNNKELRKIDQGTDQVTLLALSPDGKKVLSCNPNRRNVVYDVTSGKSLFSLEWKANGFDKAVFSPDGSVIITCDWDSNIFIWNAHDGQLIKTLVGHHGRIAAFTFSPDGKRLISASSDRTARIWNLETENETDISPLIGHGGGVNCVTFTSDGKRIVTGSDDRTIKIWDSETGYELLTLQGHKESVICVGFTKDNRCLISASSDGVVKVWDAAETNVTKSDESLADKPYYERIHTVMWDTERYEITFAGEQRITESKLGTIDKHVDGLSFHPNGQIAFSSGNGTTPDMTLAYWSPSVIGKSIVNLQYDESLAREKEGFFWFFAGPLAFGPDGTCYFSLGGCTPNGIYKVISSLPVQIEKLYTLDASNYLQIPLFDTHHLYFTSFDENSIFRYPIIPDYKKQEKEPWFSVMGDRIDVRNPLIVNANQIIVHVLFLGPTNKDSYFKALIFDRNGKCFRVLPDKMGAMAISGNGQKMIRFDYSEHAIYEFSLMSQ